MIDSYCRQYLNKSNIEILQTNKKVCNSHSYFTSLSFTQYNIPITIITTDFSKNSLINIFESLLKLKVSNPIFLPFGIDSNVTEITNLLKLFNSNQVCCSFNNISDKKNYPSILPFVTSIAANDYKKNYYFKYDKIDNNFYQLVNPIKVIKKKLVYNSFILGDYYYSTTKNIRINNKKEIVMPLWNFENNYEFEVKKDELFGYQVVDDETAYASSIPEGINFVDGFLYGSTDSISTIKIVVNNEERTFTINPSKENNYQFSILAKKW